MCFSAEASFIGGATLTAIGTASVVKANRSVYTFFAAIPLLFGLQQIAEGFLWLALARPDWWLMKELSTRIFLFFANFLWPIWVPHSIVKLEDNPHKKRLVKVLTAVGAGVALFYFFTILMAPVDPKIVGNHIKYGFKTLSPLRISIFVLYVAATVPPFFIAGNKHVQRFGAIMLVSLLVSLVFFLQFVTSVWCFFAALISVYIYWIVQQQKQQHV